MRPAQKEFSPGADGGQIFKLAKHCFANLVGCIDLIKLTHIFQVSNREAFSIRMCQIVRQLAQNLLAVSSAILPVLFFLNDHPTDLKIGINHREVHGGLCGFPCLRQDSGDVFQELIADRHVQFLLAHYKTSR